MNITKKTMASSKEKARLHYLLHKSEYLARSKEAKKANPEYYAEKSRQWHKTPKGLYHSTKQSAKQRKKPFLLTFEEYSQLRQKPCFYCSGPVASATGGLDRVDNALGYTIENVVPCCFTCNNVKGTAFTVEETKVMIRAVQEYRKSAPKSV